ncbi:Wobble nucleotide-excising tRNase [Cupriavidus sp. H18C1]|uniref:AAA family ATPase n=1 Tax=Cupriavidus sp. H18C1 TaxID=3241601 RepID=UPI003BB8DA91
MTTIKSIRKLTNYGIFQSFDGTKTQPFGKLNLIYGWNGSGKSTLSTVFETLQLRTPLSHTRFHNADLQIDLTDGDPITSATIPGCSLNIHTFNHGFIKRNIDWDKSVKGILLVAKEKIEEKKSLEALHKQLEQVINEEQEQLKKVRELDASISKFLTESAKRTKTSLQVIDVNDSRYFNYNKTKLEDFLRSHATAVKDLSSILPTEELAALTRAARPEHRPNIELSLNQVQFDGFTKAHERLSDLLRTSAVNAAISRLAQHSELQAWVANGIELHQNLSSEVCEFCGGDLHPSRLHELQAHFNEEYKNFQARLSAADTWLNSQYIDVSNLPSESDLYDEFRGAYETAATELRAAVQKLNNCIVKWHDTLREKITNQFNVKLQVFPIPRELIASVQAGMSAVIAQVSAHNKKTSNFREETKKSKERLELHYAAVEARDFGYFEKCMDRTATEAKREGRARLRQNLEQQVGRLEQSLSSAGIGAEQFNAALHRFLGRSEISLRFKPATGGYEIVRHNGSQHDGNLSEGEKTAIAFVYFITKLTENDNRIEDSIIVVDDPISSFDSNYLFHAYSYLRANCEKAKQLFVLTHNFNFYKLVRDWYAKTNSNRAQKGKGPSAFFYVLETDNALPRCSQLKNANETLVRYHSEYHYIFSRLHQFREHESLSIEDSFLSANLARKLLEAFLSFKFPRQRGDIASLMAAALEGCKTTTVETKERIYRFINKYSHSDYIEIDSDASENLHGESRNVIALIFEWMRELDPVHLAEMETVVGSPS